MRRRLQSLAEFLVVAFCTAAFLFTACGCVYSLLKPGAAGQRDFVEYWASGQQLAHHSDPYAGDTLLRIERGAGLPPDQLAMIMGNAPPALLLVLPLGHFPAMRAELFWTMFLLVFLAVSVELIRQIHGRPHDPLHLLAFSFGPAVCCILTGQMSMLVLLGLALFLYLQRTRPDWAGASLWLCLLKPQLFLPFGVVLLIWAIATPRYRILAGAAIALAASCVMIALIDPAAWTQYHHMMGVVRYDHGVLPCLANLLRRIVAPNVFWVQYIPAAAACVWSVDYYRRHRADWDWITHGSLLMLVSLVVAPYTWLTDQVVLIPALLHGLYVTRSRALVAALALASSAVQLSIFAGGTQSLHSPWLLCTAPFWLVWYLLATAKGARTGAQHESLALTTT